MDTKHGYHIPIPDKDQTFTLLPDNKEVVFAHLDELLNHVQNEIAAWTNVDNTIADKYKRVLNEATKVVAGASIPRIRVGALTEAKNLLSRWSVDAKGISSCVDSNSRFGRYIQKLRKTGRNATTFRDYSLVAVCVLDYPHPPLSFNSTIAELSLAAAKVAKDFACPEDLSEKVSEYQKRLEDLTLAADAQKSDYELRMSQFDKNEQEYVQRRNAELSKEEAEFTKRLDKADQRINALEETYSKKLQLAAPAQYWNDLARSYLCRGWVLLFVTFFLGIVVAQQLFGILLNTDSISLFNQKELNLVTIRGSLILIVMTSIAGYLLHLFTKLAISSFHLSRDYRERFQLTRVFLALLNDGDVKWDDKVKQIVMQSLFSRSDTGLLKGEHSFAMPGVSDLLKSNNT